MDTQEILNQISNKKNLNIEQTQFLFRKIMSGNLDDNTISSILISLSDKGETADEITGGASVMKEKSLKVDLNVDAIDMCGTGGDGKHSLNISTAASIVLSSMGIKVAKHGNKGLSSKCGSADVLEELGIDIMKNPEQVKRDIESKNFGFMFAPIYHQAMKNVANVRKQIKKRTIFNLLGPLCNPASVHYQCVGIFSEKLLNTYAESLIKLGAKKAWVFHSRDGLDEISIFDKTDVLEINQSNIKKILINPRDFINHNYHLTDIIGGDAKFNALKIRNLCKGENNAFLEIVSLNCAAALLVLGIEIDLPNAYKKVRSHILSGLVLKQLETLRI
jgi:anthranilate phosphoribosyltransferase